LLPTLADKRWSEGIHAGLSREKKKDWCKLLDLQITKKNGVKWLHTLRRLTNERQWFQEEGAHCEALDEEEVLREPVCREMMF
jgi:hypothetical protein